MTRAAHAVTIGMCLLGAVSASATTIEGTATILGRPAVDAVVYVDGTHPSPPPVPAPHVVMDQKNLAFIPHVLPVARGTVVEFMNSDDVQHNVFSPSATAGKFDLGTYGPGATRTLTLDQPGDVRVLCNIHMEMEAHILVLDGPHFSVVAQDGSFQIPDVPAGTYTLKIWRMRWLPFTRTVEVPASANFKVTVAVGE
jgi:plastocyanin